MSLQHVFTATLLAISMLASVAAQESKPKTASPTSAKGDGSKKSDDQERLVGRVVDSLAAEFTFDTLFGEPPVKSQFGGSFLKSEAIQRIAAYDEELELRFARCIAAIYPQSINNPDFEKTVNTYLSIEAANKGLAEDRKYLEVRVKVAVMRMTARKKNVNLQPLEQELETKFNEAMTPDDAAAIARVASILKAGTTKEVLALRKQTKDGLRQAVMKHSEVLALFAEAQEQTDERVPVRE